MDVHVHPLRWAIEEQHEGGKAARGQHVGIGAADGPGDELVAHAAAVDEHVLLGGVVARPCRQAGEAAHPHPLALKLERHGVLHELRPEDAADAGFLALLLRHVDQAAFLGDEGETHLRVCQRHAAHDLCRLHRLRPVGLEELEAGRRGEEQVLDVDLGADIERRRTRWREVPAFHGDDMGIAATPRP